MRAVKHSIFVICVLAMAGCKTVNMSTNDDLDARLLKGVMQENVDVAKLALQDGANPNATFGAARAPVLMIAAINNDVDMLETLVDSGADVNYKDDDGITALLVALENGASRAALYLIDKGAKPASTSSLIDKNTMVNNVLFNIKSSDARGELLGYLLSNGADPNEKGTLSVPPLELAIRQNDTKSIQILVCNGAESVSTPVMDIAVEKVADEPRAYSVEAVRRSGVKAVDYSVSCD